MLYWNFSRSLGESIVMFHHTWNGMEWKSYPLELGVFTELFSVRLAETGAYLNFNFVSWNKFNLSKISFKLFYEFAKSWFITAVQKLLC